MSDVEEDELIKICENVGNNLIDVFQQIGNILDEKIGDNFSEKLVKNLEKTEEHLEDDSKVVKEISNSFAKFLNTYNENECSTKQKCSMNDISSLADQYKLINQKIENLDENETKEFWSKYHGISSSNLLNISEAISRLEEKIDDITVEISTIRKKD